MRGFICWRWGSPAQTRWVPDDEPAPDPSAEPVNYRSLMEFSARQEDKSNGHYGAYPLCFDVPAGKTRYIDFPVPDYTRGLDLLQIHWPANDWEMGDLIVTGKLMAGQIGQLASDAAQGATVVTVASTLGVLKPTSLGGSLDEGFFLSFGDDIVTDANINAADPTINLINPSPELPELEIKRLGVETDIGGGNGTCSITLFSGLPSAIAAGTPVNLVVRFIRGSLEIATGDVIDMGVETLKSGNLPGLRRGRFGAKNTSASTNKRVRARLSMMY